MGAFEQGGTGTEAQDERLRATIAEMGPALGWDAGFSEMTFVGGSNVHY